MEIALGISLIVMAAFLVVSVLMQSGKDKRSGVITGGAETSFGETKGTAIDRALSKATTIVSIIFVIVATVLYIMVA